MNETTSTNPSLSSSSPELTAESISRRAYELWEKEGRPEGRDLHHWLRAEHELRAEPRTPAASSPETGRPANTDTQPLQGTRAAAAMAREPRPASKRGSTPPFAGDKAVRNGGRSRM